MKKLLAILLFPLLMGACTSDTDDTGGLVRSVVLPDEGVVFAPGDEVEITALGFEAQDDVFVRSSRDGQLTVLRAEAVETGSERLRFILPGGFAAGEVEVLLMRRGEVMTLGRLTVSDGLPPSEYGLYALSHGEDGVVSLSRIDRLTGERTELGTLPSGQDLRCAVNDTGSNRLYGVNASGGRTVAYFDLTAVRYTTYPQMERVALAGLAGIGQPAFLQYEGERRLVLHDWGVGRSVDGNRLAWTLPAGLPADALVETPFVFSVGDRALLLAARSAEGMLAPLALPVTPPLRARQGEPIEADALLPFRMVLPSDREPGKYVWSCGYALSRGGTTELRLYDAATMTFAETIAEVPAAVVSLAALPGEAALFYLLCEAEGGRRIYALDLAKGTFELLTEAEGVDGIVLAR